MDIDIHPTDSNDVFRGVHAADVTLNHSYQPKTEVVALPRKHITHLDSNAHFPSCFNIHT